MGPIDYSTNVQQPFQAALQGFSGGLAVKQALDAQEQAAIQKQAAQQMQRDVIAFANNPNRSASDYSSMIAKYPQLSEHYKRAFDVENPEKKANQVSQLSQVFAAVQSGKPDVAVELLQRQADASRASGDTKGAAGTEAMLRLVKMNPQGAQTAIGLALHAATGDDKFAEVLSKLGVEQRAAAKAPAELATAQANAVKTGAEATTAVVTAQNAPAKQQADIAATVAGTDEKRAQIKNISSQIVERAGRLGLDRDKFVADTQLRIAELNQKAGELPEGARKTVDDAAATGVASEQSVRQYTDLANRLTTQLGASWGAGGSAAEWLKKATGSQDAVTALRQEYTRIATTGVLKMLPPGPASDKDIQLAREGVPPATASPQVMAGYLRGMAKLAAYDAAMNSAKAEWVAQNKHQGNATRDLNVSGVQVPKGMTFAEFARQVVERKAAEITTQSTIQGASYGEWANRPAGAAVPNEQRPAGMD